MIDYNKFVDILTKKVEYDNFVNKLEDIFNTDLMNSGLDIGYQWLDAIWSISFDEEGCDIIADELSKDKIVYKDLWNKIKDHRIM